MKRLDIFRWSIALLILAFGVLTYDTKISTRWLVLTLVLYGVPLVAQLIPRTTVRVYGIYFGLFVMLQALISAHFFPDTFKTLSPNLNTIVTVEGDNLPGISGPQHITTDAKGFRTTKKVNYDAKADYRIFFVGASTVAQAWIDDKQSFPHLVQESLSAALKRNVETVNTAVSGIRAVHHLVTIKKVARYHPNMFVIVPGANDWGLHITLHYDKNNPDRFEHSTVHVEANRYRVAFLDYFRNYTLKHTLLGRGINAAKYIAQAQLSERSTKAGEIVRTTTDAPFYKANRGSLFRKDKRTFKPKAVHPGYAKTMREIVAFCKSSGAICVLASHPHSFKPGTTKAYRERFWMTPAFEDYTLTHESMAHIAGLYNRYTAELARKSGLPFCDLEAQVPPSLENFYDEIHYNTEGSRKAAAVLHNCLLNVIRSKAMATPSKVSSK
ncbi:MAG: GDSL-type esterase/lipase family protein [Alphaproteobacteria bacterium]|nr:GDSL-type esterase/lipase family protein [Alphaproteobacteria bacterium]